MKITLTLVDDKGRTFEGVAVLTAGKGSRTTRPVQAKSAGTARIPLTLNLRAFAKRFAKQKNGAQQFTLLLAHVSKGDTAAEIPRTDIEAAWGTLVGLLGGPFQSIHATRAKENGWVDSPRRGTYKLSPDWQECIESEGDGV